jgi:hypothetical protein
MPHRKVKLALHFLVARKAEVRLLLLQKALSHLRPVHPMAIVARHRAQWMHSPPELKKFLLFLVALQTGIRSNHSILSLIGQDKPLPFCLRVLFSGTVARLTVLLSMRAFLQGPVEIRMTPAADLRPHISFLCFLLPKRRKADEGYRDRQGK